MIFTATLHILQTTFFFLSFLVGFNVKAQLGRRLLVLFAYKIIVVRQPHLVLVWLFFFFFLKGKPWNIYPKVMKHFQPEATKRHCSCRLSPSSFPPLPAEGSFGNHRSIKKSHKSSEHFSLIIPSNREYNIDPNKNYQPILIPTLCIFPLPTSLPLFIERELD